MIFWKTLLSHLGKVNISVLMPAGLPQDGKSSKETLGEAVMQVKAHAPDERNFKNNNNDLSVSWVPPVGLFPS